VAEPSKPPAADPEGDLSPEEFHTPGRKTIAEVAEFTRLPEASQMKSLVLVADGKPVLVMLRGDHQLNEAKFGAVSSDPEFRPARPDEIREWFGAEAGSLGPVGVTNMPILADQALVGRRNMIAGANKDDHHLRNVKISRPKSATCARWRRAISARSAAVSWNCGRRSRSATFSSWATSTRSRWGCGC